MLSDRNKSKNVGAFISGHTVKFKDSFHYLGTVKSLQWFCWLLSVLQDNQAVSQVEQFCSPSSFQFVMLQTNLSVVSAASGLCPDPGRGPFIVLILACFVCVCSGSRGMWNSKQCNRWKKTQGLSKCPTCNYHPSHLSSKVPTLTPIPICL